MLSAKGEVIGLSPRKASLRNNNRQQTEDHSSTFDAEVLHKYTNELVQCKNVNLKSEIENSKRKRRESHETSGSDKDESRRQQGLIVPKMSLSPPTVNLSAMDVKKCKFETERERMFRIYQPWVLKTYGDSSKTKTITTKKQNRIIRTLCGMEYNNPDSSKFRYWVKVKGFTTKTSDENEFRDRNDEDLTEGKCLLSIPSKEDNGAEKFKKVAVVELFFDIIFGVHIGSGEKDRRHSGQKRTYRMITETYAFLPREAVTKFLSNCTTCKKLSRTNNSDMETKEVPEETYESNSSSREPVISMRKDLFTSNSNNSPALEMIRDPETTLKMKQAASDVVSTYLQLTRTLGLADVDALAMGSLKASSTSAAAAASDVSPPPPKAASPAALLMPHESSAVSALSPTPLQMIQRQPTPTHNDSPSDAAAAAAGGIKVGLDSSNPDPPPILNPKDNPFSGLMKDADKLKLMLLAWNYQNSNAAARNGTEGPDLSMMNGLWTHYQSVMAAAEKNTAQPNGNNSPIEQLEETNSSGQKEDEDGSEDESDEKNESVSHNPERLKAFNMFVRLFVDENLDRMVPISKQPKEKIQAIIDSCTRQFPEFAERARKRIRTYLKSCRRNKKVRDGWDSTPRPTPAHLTSAQAEQILAQACENESMNAKRMRIGMEPIGTNYFQTTAGTAAPSSPSHSQTNNSAMDLNGSGGSFMNSPSKLENGFSSTPQKMSMSPVYAPAEITRSNNNSSPAAYDFNGQANSAAATVTTKSFPNYFNNHISNVPTDLSMKTNKPTIDQQLDRTQTMCHTTVTTVNPVFQATPAKLPMLTHKLNPSEINAVRQLVTGYRESAAFLLRSAEELEQLLLQQQQQQP